MFEDKKLMAMVLKLISRVFLKFPSLKQFVRFSLVGLLNTAVDFALYYMLTRTISWFAENYLIANAISFTLAVTNSFFLNKLWTFNAKWLKSPRVKFLLFMVTNIITLAVVEICLWWLVNQLDIFDLFAKVLVIIVSVILNFTFSKFLIFRS